MKEAVRNYSLSITLAALFLLSWIAHGFFQWQQFVSEQTQHRENPQIREYVHEFMASTFENWQSEFLQLLTFVVLTTFLIHKGSHESKDSDLEIKERLARIEKNLAKFQKKEDLSK